MNEIRLLEAKRNKVYKIKRLEVESADAQRFLKNIGISGGEDISIVQSNFGKSAFLVNISGTNYALDKIVCNGIFVE